MAAASFRAARFNGYKFPTPPVFPEWQRALTASNTNGTELSPNRPN
jgi:hypothetical protein